MWLQCQVLNRLLAVSMFARAYNTLSHQNISINHSISSAQWLLGAVEACISPSADRSDSS